MAKQEFSLPALMQRVQTEVDAYLLLEDLRWNGTPVCPHCGVLGGHYFLKAKDEAGRKTRTGSRSERRVWKCAACRKQFSVLTGTIFHGTKMPVRTWVLVIADLCAAKNGMSAREVERKYDLTPKTAWFMIHRLREAMKRKPLAGLLSGTAQADETFIGGEPKNRHRNDPREPIRAYATTDKTPVLSLIDYETREVRSRVVPDVGGTTLHAAIREQVDGSRTMLHTDGAKPYLTVARDMRGHESVDHGGGQYVHRTPSGKVTTNAVQGYFSQLKRSIDGTHHHVSKAHLDLLPRALRLHVLVLPQDRLGADARAGGPDRWAAANLQATDWR